MVIEIFVKETKRLGRRKTLKALLRENGTVKQADITIPRRTQPTPAQIQAAWDQSPVLTDGASLWPDYLLRNEDEINRAVIKAVFEIIDANGTVKDAVAAGVALLPANSRPAILYTKLLEALKKATPIDESALIALLNVVAGNKIVQR